jgi:hypothetical protein
MDGNGMADKRFMVGHGRSKPLMSLRSHMALCGLIGTPRHNELEQDYIHIYYNF